MTELGGLTRGPRGPRILTIAVLAAGALALAAAPAQATKPRITAPPQIAGTAQVGQTLTEQGAQWDGRPPPTVTWSWWRCDSPQPDDCTEIANTNATTYKVVAADQGKRLRVLLFVENRDGSRWSLSAATNPVTAAPPPPPAPAPTPTPTPSPTPTPDDTSGPPAPVPPPAAPVIAPLTPAAPEALRAPTMMSPFPVVRIVGRLTRTGARITLLTVTAPKGARISLTCKGSSCPARRWARATKVTRILRFQRMLKAGTKLVITVTKRGSIGKRTTLLIRRAKAPWRRDRCLYPGRRHSTRCPAA